MSIILHQLTKTYQGLPVVTKVSLEIQDGEMFVLLGGSGSGKSTILRMIAGLARPDSGTIELHGKDVTQLPAQARGTGFVFQNYSIFRHMTVSDNVEFGLLVRKVAPPERRRRAEELMDLVGLAGLGKRFPDQLSGGQLQRVALARALAYQPSVLLLDEPFGALDVKIRTQLRRSLKEIQRELKVTAILVTHDQEEGFELADRIGVLDRGHLIEVGTPESLYHQPSSQYVASFVGGGNVLVGKFCGGQICLGSAQLAMPESAPAHLEGATVRVLIRAENLDISQATPQGTLLGSGRVVESIFVGSQQRLRLEMEALQGVRCIAPVPAYGQSIPQLEAAIGHRKETPQFQPGQTVAVGVLHFHVLERTGLRSLILAERGSEGEAAVAFGCLLAETVGAPATLLSVAAPREDPQIVNAHLERLLTLWKTRLPALRTIVGRGASSDEIKREVREGLHEMVVIGEDPGPPVTRLTPANQRLLEQIEVPLLLVQVPRPQLRRILICTAAGEAGKADVWMGGRVAKRAGARVTVVHVIRPTAVRSRGEAHLQRALASLTAMGVLTEARLLEGDQVSALILGEAEAGDYDLLVLGSALSPVSLKIARGTSRPLLFVPLVE